ncbi:4F2 cell-surface antigen heavy chain [Chionoecetes opilio]|uniref:4F2 cell-surface antigen heavy chain n=1 Tax=Chionoecetes opilio TaxID=41210 RepID=A0A8J4XP84_CHIOP|nr:4F2 cell-surface antigen heavy chain [Chionoecetes opilio]
MTEEKNGLAHGPANSEMAPQEDGTKVPLTDEAGVKFSSNNPPNGDSKIDIKPNQVFSGLTKEELMKYADDPFWVRLRWFLFILFWGGWLAMLVMAIVIIIQTPRCAPKESLDWVQETAILQYDVRHAVDIDENGEETPEDMVKLAANLGMKTVYLEDLISTFNFENLNGIYNAGNITAALKAAKDAGLHVVTDFVPSPVPDTNTWYQNTNMSDFFEPNSRKLDFSNQGLLDKLVDLFSTTWKDRGVLGFIADNADETLANATAIITKGIQDKDVDGHVVYGVKDVNHQLNTFSVEAYQDFLESGADDWSYFKFNPKQAESELSSKDLAQLVTMSLFLVRGTPILHGLEKDYLKNQTAFIKSLSEFREKESVQIGDMTFLNTTSEDVMAFARVKKGTPGCAVAVNFHQYNSTEIDFRSIAGVPEKGDIHLKLSGATMESGELGRTDLSKVPLQPLEGVVVLFVPADL